MGKSIKSANAAARQNALDSLDGLGQDQIGFDIINTNENPLEEAIGNFITRVKENIQSANMIVTGKIEDIRMKVDNNRILITANPWLIYQSRGVSGTITKYDTPHAYTDKMPPVDVFIDYIKTKNIQLRDNKKYYGDESPFKDLDDDKKIISAAWGMAMKTYLHGIKPRHIYSKEIPQLIEDVTKVAANFAVQQVVQLFDVKTESKRIIIKK